MSKALKLALASAQALSSSLGKSVPRIKSASNIGQRGLFCYNGGKTPAHLHSSRPCSNPRTQTSLIAGCAPSHCSKSSQLMKAQACGLISSNSSGMHSANYSTEVDKEISSFLEKEIKFENSRSSDSLPKIPGFEITTNGADVTLTRTSGAEKIVVRLSVNGAVDSVLAEADQEKQDEPPQMLCRPPFEVEISKGGDAVLALQCSFPSIDDAFENADQYSKGEQGTEEIDDQFEIQEVALHNGEWKDTTFSVSAATMDAELFDLLMDMLDERGINDEFIAQLVEYCTAYENSLYIKFLKGLKSFSEV